MIVAEDREADVQAARDAAVHLLAIPENVIEHDLRGGPTVMSEALTQERERARQDELLRVVRIDLENIAANLLRAEFPLADALLQGRQRRLILDVGGRANARGGKDGAELGKGHRVRLADEGLKDAVELLPALELARLP